MKTRAAKGDGKTGKKGLGDVVGFDPHVELRRERLASYRLKLGREQADRLAKLLTPKAVDHSGFMLTATSERFERLRVLATPAPNYELRAAPRHIRGDAVRVTGTRRSCNITLSDDGAGLVRERLRDSLKAVREWVEMRARVVRHTPDEGPRCVLESIPDAEFQSSRDDDHFGRTGLVLAGQVWPKDNFDDWET